MLQVPLVGVLLLSWKLASDLVKLLLIWDRFTNAIVTGQDCKQNVETFPVCVDPTANMYDDGVSHGYFCCAQGATGIKPLSGRPFCQIGDSSVPASRLATMVCLDKYICTYRLLTNSLGQPIWSFNSPAFHDGYFSCNGSSNNYCYYPNGEVVKWYIIYKHFHIR